jgi:quercetin dioxygenase-like cupin family protein
MEVSEMKEMTRDDHENTEGTYGQMASRVFWFLDGNHLTVLADQTDTGGRYDLIEGRAPAGMQTPPHRHTRYDEQLYVLDGEHTVWAGKRKVVLHAGDTFTIPAGTAHVVAATGGGPAHGLVIASPSGFARLIEEVGTRKQAVRHRSLPLPIWSASTVSLSRLATKSSARSVPSRRRKRR